MGEFYMGMELGAEELPLNAPAPAATPPEGVILVRREQDGWTRKYLYHVKNLGGQRKNEQFLIAEIAPSGGAAAAAPTPPQQQQQQPAPSPQGALPLSLMGPGRYPVQTGLGGGRVPTVSGQSPFMAGPQANQPGQVRLAQAPPPLNPGQPAPPSGTPIPVTQGAPASPPLPQPAPGCVISAGPMQLPDGKIIQPDDPITLAELGQMLPYLIQCIAPAAPARPGPAPGGMPVVGGPGQPIPVAGAGFPSFGPATGGFGGGGFLGGGGGGFGGGNRGNNPPGPGPIGVVTGQPTPQPGGGGGGGPGPAGPPGPPGAGTGVDFLVKTDGDFTAGPGAFIPVPGTFLSFTQGATGPAVFLLNACFGCGNATNDALAILVDGSTLIPLQADIFHTFVGGVGGFFQPCSAIWPMILAAGPHTVQVMLRGIGAGEFCAGSGFGFPATIAATTAVPLTLTVLHQSVGAPAAAAPVLTVDGLSKTDGNFSATGALTAVPGTFLAFTVTTPGNAQVVMSADFAAAIKSSLPSISLGIIVDGGTPLLLATKSENNGSGGDGNFTEHLTAMIVLPGLTPGPHSVQMAYSSGGGANLMSLVAVPTQPATLSVIHP